MWGAPGRGAWSSSPRTNLSCYCCLFFDFPWPLGSNIFPKRSVVVGSLNDYAVEFLLHRHFCIGRPVELVEPAGPNRWTLTVSRVGVRERRCFDHVVVAIGVFSHPHVREFKGLDRFRGKVFHASECYSEDVNLAHFIGKRVLVMGGAFSGTEIAGQLVDIADSVTVGLRYPMWFLPRWVQP